MVGSRRTGARQVDENEPVIWVAARTVEFKAGQTVAGDWLGSLRKTDDACGRKATLRFESRGPVQDWRCVPVPETLLLPGPAAYRRRHGPRR